MTPPTTILRGLRPRRRAFALVTAIVAGTTTLHAQDAPSADDELRRQLAAQEELLKAQQAELDALAAQVRQWQARDKVSGQPDAQGLRESLEESEQRERVVFEKHFIDRVTTDKRNVSEGGALPFGWLPMGKSGSELRIGGFVRFDALHDFDPIDSIRSFIPAEIPVPPGDAAQSRTTLTARQTRLTLQSRSPSEVGDVKTYLSVDFMGEGDGSGLQLRQAYVQLSNWLLVGHAWSTFVDLAALPNTLDYEGLNSSIQARQALVRFIQPLHAQGKVHLSLALEAPESEVTNGVGETRFPDAVASLQWGEDWGHLRAGFIARDLRATSDQGGPVASALGYGVSLSSQVKLPALGSHDNFMVQATYGPGVGRYFDDLGSIPGQDAVYDPTTGELDPLNALGGYLGYQHWWSEGLRSTATYGRLHVDNSDLQAAGAFHASSYASANLVWSPIPSLNVGIETLWGQRENQDGERGDAKRLQLAFWTLL